MGYKFEWIFLGWVFVRPGFHAPDDYKGPVGPIPYPLGPLKVRPYIAKIHLLIFFVFYLSKVSPPSQRYSRVEQ